MLVVATQRKGRDKASDFSRQVERALSGKISGKAAKGMQISQIRQSPCKNLPSSQVWKLLHWTLHKASKKKDVNSLCFNSYVDLIPTSLLTAIRGWKKF